MSSIFFSCTLLSMEVGENDTVSFEPKYTAKALSLLKSEFNPIQPSVVIMGQNGLTFIRRNEDFIKKEFADLETILKTSPSKFFLMASNLPQTHPSLFIFSNLKVNWNAIISLTHNYLIECESHYVKKTSDILDKLRCNYERYQSQNLPGDTQDRKNAISKKIEKIKTWNQRLQEFPYDISNVLEEITETFAAAHQGCKRFQNIDRNALQNETEKLVILSVLQTLGANLDSLHTLYTGYLSSSLNMATNYVLEEPDTRIIINLNDTINIVDVTLDENILTKNINDVHNFHNYCIRS